MTVRTAADFKVGQLVTYLPRHANGNERHPDCQSGVVTSANDTYVFVRFVPEHWPGFPHGQACTPDQLRIIRA